MPSLYQISDDILKIFAEVEENDGEITEEQCDKLAISQEELRQKLNNYYKAVIAFEADEAFCKAEKKRINDVQNKYKNRVNRLKQAMLNAVLAFGEEGKNNFFIELPTARLFTKESKSVKVNEERINILLNEFERYIQELVGSGVLYTGQDVDLQGILDCINANVIAEQGENFEPFTLSDLTTIQFQFTKTATVYDLFRNGRSALEMYYHDPINTTIQNNTSVDEWKTAIKISENTGISNITLAKIVTNQNLQIK